jgi:hypothetical protein
MSEPVVFGNSLDGPSDPGGEGSVHSKLSRMTLQLQDISHGVSGGISISGVSVNIPNPLGVSGTVSLTAENIEIGKVDQGFGNAAGSPWAVSGNVSIAGTPNVSISNQPTVTQGTANAGGSPWSVSGNVSILGTPNVSVTNQPSVTQGTANAGSSPWAVSGSVSLLGTPNVAVTNQPTINQGIANAGGSPWSVSGSVSIAGTPTVTANAGTGPFSTIVNKVSGTISISNSTSALLASGAVFTGLAEDVSSYASIVIASYSDVASASGGVSWQFSKDGVNWDARASYTASASGFFSAIMPAREQFFRLVYTNGTVAQTNFRLQVTFHAVDVTSSTAVPMQDNDPNPSAPRASSHLMTFNTGEGVWSRARDAMSASGSTGRGLLGVGPQLYDSSSAIWRAALGDNAGRQIVVGPAASGSSFLGNPLVIAGADASGNVRTLLTDVLGRATVQGAQANGTAITTNPFIISHIHSDATCRLIGSAAAATNTTGINLLGTGPCLWDSVGGVNFVKQAGDGSGRAIVVGAAAAGAALAGNPVLLGVSDGSLVQVLKQVSPTNTVSSTGILAAGAMLDAGGATSNRQWAAVTTTGDSSNGINIGGVAPMLFGGTNFERQRNNIDATLLASAIRTTTSSGADITTYNLQGILICLDVTAGSGSLTVTVNGKCPASAKYYPILTGTLVTTNSFNVYRIYPGLTAVAGSTVNDHLPRIINIVISHGNANLVTYSAGYTLLI